MKMLTTLLMGISLTAFGQNKVAYTVHYSENMVSEGLRVHVSYKAKQKADSTYFHYSDKVWGEQHLVENLQFPEAENEGLRIRVDADSNRIIVHHPSSKHIAFTYIIRQPDTTQSDHARNTPRIEKDFFHILGENLFSVPETVITESADARPEVDATIHWEGFPEGYLLANSFGINEQVQHIKTPLWSSFYHSLFVGGDYRLHTFKHHDKPVNFLIRGNWLNAYTDENLLNELKRTISVQRDFWEDQDFPTYTVFLTPTVSRTDSTFSGSSMTGSSIHDGFLIQSTNNPFNNWSVVEYIFNHEMMHDWIGGRIRNGHEELNYWFSEGFTDYYTYKNRLRSGSMSFDDWLNDFNRQVFAAHWKNPERNCPNYRIKDDFWLSRDVEKVPYRRGTLFAFWLDNQIQLRSKGTQSLDDLMRELLKMCNEDEETRLTDELFLKLAKSYMKEDISYFFQKHLLVGEDIDWMEAKLIPGFSIELVDGIPQLKAEATVQDDWLKN